MSGYRHNVKAEAIERRARVPVGTVEVFTRAGISYARPVRGTCETCRAVESACLRLGFSYRGAVA